MLPPDTLSSSLPLLGRGGWHGRMLGATRAGVCVWAGGGGGEGRTAEGAVYVVSINIPHNTLSNGHINTLHTEAAYLHTYIYAGRD